MEVWLYVLVPVAAVVGLLWWINRRNPGTFRSGDEHAEDHMETRKDWGPR